jgi:FtsP/CotA-like multicopper oxidase with cupredoxin domain
MRNRNYGRRVLGTALVLASLLSTRSDAAQTRLYYVAADEVAWDLAPSGINQITGKAFEGLAAIGVMVPAADRLGRIYKKAIYREYTDATFATLKSRPPEWEHLGMLGPLLRAEVGDTIEIAFKNNTTRPVSMHPHGVFYTKSSEGAPYADGTTGSDKMDDAVPPGGTHRYVWQVPERAGPEHGEQSSILWMYHSHVDETADVNAGLIGPLIVTRRGEARPDGSPRDVDTEIVAAFMEIDENVSPYFEDNIKAYAAEPAKFPRGAHFADPYYLANLKETINGFSFGHTPPMRMRQGARARWYIMSSSNFEIHAPHWHANTVVAMHMRTDVLNLLPMGMIVADMVPDNPGVWLFHCHVGPHLDAGMVTRYEVLPAAK